MLSSTGSTVSSYGRRAAALSPPLDEPNNLAPGELAHEISQLRTSLAQTSSQLLVETSARASAEAAAARAEILCSKCGASARFFAAFAR